MPPPKKRERSELETTNKQNNGHQQEQELFLQAFEKPTQIYRFLRNRHGTSPIFLNRTLSYMKDRMSRNNKKRASFKVNSILETITHKSETATNNYLNIVFHGLFDKSATSEQWWNAGDVVSVESALYKITKSKRKDSTSDFQEVLSNTSNVIFNPHDNINKLSAISIPVQSMKPFGDQHTIYKLLFRIKVLPKYAAKNLQNGDEEEMPSKRSKPNPKILGCELIVFEKNFGCIPEGDYEAALPELSSSSIKSFSPKKRTWETLPDNYMPLSLKFDVFSQCPTLNFRLTWSPSDIPTTIDIKELSHYGCFSDILQHAASNGDSDAINGNTENNSNAPENQINHNNNCIKASNSTGAGPAATANSVVGKDEKIQIVYNFLYSNNTRQQTEYTQEVVCPWCTLDCLRLYALLKHLKLCHARFNFTYQPAGNGARIDVTINDSYDGSYAGSPYDLAGPSGCSFARTCGPVRRTSVTNLLVCRPRRQKTCLDEFLVLDEDDLSNQRPYITGHNRLYHHTETCLPVHPKELDIDSEGESDPLWLRQKTIQMIDEFSDVNEGEKELMKLWNLHVMKHGYVGDCQLPLACEMFLDANGHEIIRKNLYRNFILHMCSLFDYGLVSPESVYKTVQKLQGMLVKYPEGQQMMSEQRESQLKYWLDVGIHKQDEQKLKSPLKQPQVATGLGIIAVIAASAGGGGAAIADIKAMHPPAKRAAASPITRAGISPSSGINSDKTTNDSGANISGKPATQEEAGRPDRNGLKRNAATPANEKEKSNENKISVSIAGGVKSQETVEAGLTTAKLSVKRRLSTIKDTTTKRNSSSNSNSTNTSNSGGGSNNSTRSSSNLTLLKNEPSTTLPKRLVTRRQSIAATSAASQVNEKNSKSTHSLRTRLSVPLTKADKR